MNESTAACTAPTPTPTPTPDADSDADADADPDPDADAAPDTQAPSVPQGFRTTGTTQTSISVAWDASTDNVGVTGYRIYRNGTRSSGARPATNYTLHRPRLRHASTRSA